jgi:hypothetical protein
MHFVPAGPNIRPSHFREQSSGNAALPIMEHEGYDADTVPPFAELLCV